MNAWRRWYRQLAWWQGLLLLLVMMLVILGTWWYLLYPRLLQDNQFLAAENYAASHEKQKLERALADTAQFVFDDQIQTESPETLISGLATKSSIPGVTLSSYKALGYETLVVDYGDMQFLNETLDAELSPHLYKKRFEVELTGNFEAIKRYLGELSQSDEALYWEAMDYEVAVWPEAVVTLQGFVLRTEQ